MRLRYIILFLFSVCSGLVQGQSTKELVDLTNEYMSVGGWITAAEWAEEAKQKIIEENGLNHEKYFYIQSRIAIINTKLADYSKAQLCFKEVFDWYKKQGLTNTIEYASLLSSEANLLRRMGLYKKSESNYLTCLKLKEKEFGANHKSIAGIYNDLGNLYNAQEDFKQAEDCYLKSLEIKKQFGKTLSYSYTLNNLGWLYAHTARDSLAEKAYLEALVIKKELLGENHLTYAETLSNLALLLSKQERYIKAEEYFLHAEKIMKWKLGEDHPDYNDLLFLIAQMMEERNKMFEAQTYYNKVLDNIFVQIDQYFPSLTEEEKAKFYSTLKYRLEKYDAFALKRYKSERKTLYRMYNNQLHTKALLLNESGKVKNQILNSDDEELKAVYLKWKKKKDEYAGLLSVAQSDRKAGSPTKEQLASDIHLLEKQLAVKSSAFRHNTASSKYDWKSVYLALKPGEAAVEFIRFHDENNQVKYLALVLRKGGRKTMQLVILPEGNKMEEQYLLKYKNCITFRVKDKDSYNRYWQPIQKKLSGITKVFVSPDGVYNQLNINTLYNVDSSRYVLNETQVHMVTKTSDIIEFSNEKVIINKSKLDAVLFGRPDYLMDDNAPLIASGELEYNNIGQQRYANLVRNANFSDLPGTEVEVKGIAELIGKNLSSWGIRTFTGRDATEITLKKITNPTVLHIATHGFFIGSKSEDEKMVNPMLRSGLILAGATKYYQNNNLDGEEDGILTAMEASNLNLDSTQLVVLSACETGLGEIQKGEGVYGMFRALKIAGAKTVIMSQWKVDDNATQELMYIFYQKWMETGNKHEAFKIAQNKIKLKYESPYYWGAFVMIGE